MLTVHIISDSIGNTAKDVVKAALVQFSYSDARYKILKNSNVSTKERIESIVENIEKDDVIVQTLVDRELAEYTKRIAEEKGVKVIDLLSGMLNVFEEKLEVKPENNPGLIRKMGAEYFKRVDAIEFAVKYDDGKNPQGFLESDLVILGVSRTSKTPLSIYLANKGYKVSNLPLIPEVPLPQVLDKVDKRRMIGLVCDPDKLAKVRSNRLDALGLTQATSYTDVEKIYEELDYSKKVFQKYQAHVINMTDKSIEETACIIEEHLKSLASK